jgi:hypothetical protein
MSVYAAGLRHGSSGVLNHHTKRLQDLRQRRLAALAPGQDRTFLVGDLAAGGHETKYRRLRADTPSPTVTAHMGKDLSDFIHPSLPRTLTAREAARIQGFPDTVEFLGSQAAQFNQVGNAVPVPLARALGVALARTLRRSNERPVSRLTLLDGARPDAAELPTRPRGHLHSAMAEAQEAATADGTESLRSERERARRGLRRMRHDA